MNKLAMFVPLAKADAAQRLVYGSIDETPDRAREIMDYDSAKAAFKDWSDGLFKASGGKSYGNVRAQHDAKRAAGLLKSIDFDDDAKRISFCAHIVDDAEWAKVEAGVYTGFSPGGSYAKRWPDQAVSGHHRYTPKVGELSIVDVPCIPSGTFTMVKADGAEEEIEFVLDKAYEPGNEATKERAEEMAKAADGTTWKDHVVQARADLIVENAAQALEKMAPTEEADEGCGGHAEDAALSATPLDALDAALAKADATLATEAAENATPTAIDIFAAAYAGQMLKADADHGLDIAPPSPEAIALIGADMAKSMDALEAIRAAAEPELAKGLYTVSDAVSFLRQFSYMVSEVVWEEQAEGDTASVLPQQAVNLLNGLKAFVVAMVEEEVAELLATLGQTGRVPLALDLGSGDETMELAAQIVDLVKADEARMEKAGARNSKADSSRIQTIHDHSCDLGAECSTAAEKAAGLAEENDRLVKAIEVAAPAIERLTSEIETMRAERESDRADLAKMQAQLAAFGELPAPTKIDLTIQRSKEEDNGSFNKADEVDSEDLSNLTPTERRKALELRANSLLSNASRPAR